MEHIWLGPLGRLMQIDIPEGGYTATLAEYGAEHVPLSGRRTKDIFSRRREFKIQTDGLAPRALSWFEMLHTGALAGPHYLLESVRKNRLRARIASTGSVALALNAVSTDWVHGGTSSIIAATATLLPSPGLETPAPSKALAWVASAGSQTCADTAIIPVLPGEVLCFSAYAQAGAPTLEIVPYNAALVAQTAITGTTVIASTPPRRYVTYTVPASGIVAVSVQLRSPSSGTYTTVGWQLEAAAEPTDWQLGVGVPQVLGGFDTGGVRYAVGPYTQTTFDLKEV